MRWPPSTVVNAFPALSVSRLSNPPRQVLLLSPFFIWSNRSPEVPKLDRGHADSHPRQGLPHSAFPLGPLDEGPTPKLSNPSQLLGIHSVVTFSPFPNILSGWGSTAWAKEQSPIKSGPDRIPVAELLPRVQNLYRGPFEPRKEKLQGLGQILQVPCPGLSQSRSWLQTKARVLNYGLNDIYIFTLKSSTWKESNYKSSHYPGKTVVNTLYNSLPLKCS